MTEIITLGSAPDGAGGDSVKAAFDKVNSNFNEVDTTLESKVDKEIGKGLSETNFTQGEKTKLAGIASEATKNRADSENADKSHTHTTVDITDMSDSGKSVATGTPAQGRAGLGLGSAATKDVGVSSGQVMEVGAGGLLAAAFTLENDINKLTTSGSWQLPSGAPDTFQNIPTGVTPSRAAVVVYGNMSPYGAQMLFSRIDNTAYFRNYNSSFSSWLEIYTTGNTTIDPDGTLKASSPVINLYTDKHDLHNEGQFGATPTVVRKSKGVYEITGTLGLRSDGWYLDTPSDRNGNKYFNVEWAQNITPNAKDGVVEEYRDDIVVTIETFERVWNKDTGLFENGAPMDINELQDRFVQLRFNELKIEQEELVDENK